MLPWLAIVNFRAVYCRHDDEIRNNPAELPKVGGPLHGIAVGCAGKVFISREDGKVVCVVQ